MNEDKNDEEKPRMSAIDSELRAPETKAAPATAGAWLRAARQQKGLHIAALAALLKVPQAKLEALEADRYEQLPDATFTRALAKAMCRALKVDAAPVMLLLPAGGERELDVSRGINQPYRERGGREEGLSIGWLQRPMVWGPLLLLIAAAAVYLVPTSWLSSPTPAATDPAATPVAAPAPMASEPVATASPATESPAAASEPAPVAATTATTTETNTAATPAPAATTTAAAPVTTAASAPAAPQAPAPGELPLGFRITTDSWIQVVDGRGQVLLSKLMRAGEQQQLNGLPPLKVTIGNVAGTQLSLRGSPVDLAAQSRDNVARLELN